MKLLNSRMMSLVFLLCVLDIIAESNESLFLCAPNRAKHVPLGASATQSAVCKLCKAVEKDNPSEYPIASTKHFTLMLNLFPYTKGHLLIVAHEHGITLDALVEEQRNELAYLISFTTAKLKAALQCPGLNVGYNEGRCAGASIPNHLHLHILPRHEYNEKSFLHTITNTQLIQWDFKELQELLIPYFAELHEHV